MMDVVNSFFACITSSSNVNSEIRHYNCSSLY